MRKTWEVNGDRIMWGGGEGRGGGGGTGPQDDDGTGGDESQNLDDGTGDQDGDTGDDEQQLDADGNPIETTITSDSEFDADTFFSDGEADDGIAGLDAEEKATPVISAKDMGTQMQEAIKGAKLPDDLFPDDFNPNNREHLKAAFLRVQQTAIRQALNLMFPAVNNTLTSLERGIRRGYLSTVNSRLSNQTQGSELERTIPLAKSPVHRTLVRDTFARAIKQSKGDKRKAFTMTEKALKSMGLNPKSNPSVQPRKTSQQLNVGKSVLDAFAPLPEPPRQQQRGTQQTRDRMSR